MTGTINERALTQMFVTEQLRARHLIRQLVLAICFLLALALLLSALLTVSRQIPLCYTVSEQTVTIASGDTLWEIAGEHMGEYPGGIRSYLAEICRRNGIESSQLLAVGTTLIVPIYEYRFE